MVRTELKKRTSFHSIPPDYYRSLCAPGHPPLSLCPLCPRHPSLALLTVTAPLLCAQLLSQPPEELRSTQPSDGPSLPHSSGQLPIFPVFCERASSPPPLTGHYVQRQLHLFALALLLGTQHPSAALQL